VLRGVAILGILPVNAAYFAYATAPAGLPDYPTDAGVAVAVVVRTFFEYKFITLFSLLFGVGIGIQQFRAESQGVAFAPTIGRRLVALVIFGALHATLLWYGDIVFIYGCVGLTLCWFAGGKPTGRAWAGVVALGLPLALLGLALLVTAVASEWFPDTRSNMYPDGVGAAAANGTWAQFFEALLQGEIDPDFEAAVYASASYARASALRTVTWLWMLVFQGFYFVPRIAGLCLLGMAATRTGWALAPGSADGRRHYRLLLTAALPAGLAIEAVSTWILVRTTDETALAGAEILHYVGSLGMAGGYAAIIALVVSANPNAVWTRPFAAIGRTAFSCYIGQSIVMTTLFYGHGFALFDRLDRRELMGVVCLVWLAQLIVAPLWLTLFRMGPLEWLWRSATYMRWQPFLRAGSP